MSTPQEKIKEGIDKILGQNIEQLAIRSLHEKDNRYHLGMGDIATWRQQILHFLDKEGVRIARLATSGKDLTGANIYFVERLI